MESILIYTTQDFILYFFYTLKKKNILSWEKNLNQPTKTKQRNIGKSGNKHTIYIFYLQCY